MEHLLPGIVMSFREGLEAFLIIVIIFEFLSKTGNKHLKWSVVSWVVASIILSLVIGLILYTVGKQLENMDAVGKLWESVASLIAVGLVTTFIVHMIRHGSKIRDHVKHAVEMRLTKFGIFITTFILIAREGVEIAIFTFAGDFPMVSIIIGLAIALVVVALISLSLVRVNLSTLFRITLIYLIIQAGYLLGYGIHEGLSALKSLGHIPSSSPLLIKAFDLSGGVLNHKDWILGLPLNVLFGWYSKPEWIQLILQYVFTFGLIGYSMKHDKKR